MHSQRSEGCEQIRAGVSLIHGSRLARWKSPPPSFEPVQETDYEAGHAGVDSNFGRVISWITFSVGAEYLAKGVCIVHGRLKHRSTAVFCPPGPQVNIDKWAALVEPVPIKKLRACTDPFIREDIDTLPMLGELVTVLEDLVTGHDRTIVSAGFKLLSSAIRNRDAHTYIKNKRQSNFHLVERLFLPALNILLRTVDQPTLASCVATALPSQAGIPLGKS